MRSKKLFREKNPIAKNPHVCGTGGNKNLAWWVNNKSSIHGENASLKQFAVYSYYKYYHVKKYALSQSLNMWSSFMRGKYCSLCVCVSLNKLVCFTHSGKNLNQKIDGCFLFYVQSLSRANTLHSSKTKQKSHFILDFMPNIFFLLPSIFTKQNLRFK